PIGRNVFSVQVVHWPTALELGANFFRPVRNGDYPRGTQFFRQLPIGEKVARATVDLARFLVVLHPCQEHGWYRHWGLGRIRPLTPRRFPDQNQLFFVREFRDTSPELQGTAGISAQVLASFDGCSAPAPRSHPSPPSRKSAPSRPGVGAFAGNPLSDCCRTARSRCSAPAGAPTRGRTRA